MDQVRVIPSRVHGIIDYITGIALVLAPTIFGFEDEGGAAVWIPRLIGIMILVQSLLTAYEWGVFHLLPFNVHLAMDYMAALLLAASPFIFGFYDNPANVWMPHVIVGISELAIALLTDTHAGRARRII